MATRLVYSCSNIAKNAILRSKKTDNHIVFSPTRSITSVGTSIPGVIPARPIKNKASVPKVAACFFVGIYAGQYLAKSFAAFMEETELFVPDDDDD